VSPGATVHFLARDRGRAERAQAQIRVASGSPFVSYGLADLEDLGSVRAFAREFRTAWGSGTTAGAGPSTCCRGHAKMPARATCCGTGVRERR
jgi:hypothetical protein